MLGCPGGIAEGDSDRPAAREDVVGGGGNGRLAAGGRATGACGGGAGKAGACAACAAEVRRCSRSEKRCIVRASNACRSLLSRPCSSRSLSYCASLLPAVPTHWSTGLTCCPGGITPMLVTVPGVPAGDLAILSFAPLSVNAKISHSMPTPPSRMAPSIAYWRCLGESRSSAALNAPFTVPVAEAAALTSGALIARLRVGSRTRWCFRRGAGCGSPPPHRPPGRPPCCRGGRTPARPRP